MTTENKSPQTTDTSIADNALLANGFDWEHFKTYVNTYDPQKHGDGHAKTIMQDMLYGIGLSMDPEKYKWMDGYQTFLNHLKAWIIFLHDFIEWKKQHNVK